jgi:hypothetical protein
MAGLDPAIHVSECAQNVDARVKRGHDGEDAASLTSRVSC